MFGTQEEVEAKSLFQVFIVSPTLRLVMPLFIHRRVRGRKAPSFEEGLSLNPPSGARLRLSWMTQTPSKQWLFQGPLLLSNNPPWHKWHHIPSHRDTEDVSNGLFLLKRSLKHSFFKLFEDNEMLIFHMVHVRKAQKAEPSSHLIWMLWFPDEFTWFLNRKTRSGKKKKKD